jgi:hypothetical protein
MLIDKKGTDTQTRELQLASSMISLRMKKINPVLSKIKKMGKMTLKMKMSRKEKLRTK